MWSRRRFCWMFTITAFRTCTTRFHSGTRTFNIDERKMQYLLYYYFLHYMWWSFGLVFPVLFWVLSPPLDFLYLFPVSVASWFIIWNKYFSLPATCTLSTRWSCLHFLPLILQINANEIHLIGCMISIEFTSLPSSHRILSSVGQPGASEVVFAQEPWRDIEVDKLDCKNTVKLTAIDRTSSQQQRRCNTTSTTRS